MTKRVLIAFSLITAAAWSLSAYAQETAKPTSKATLSITGLHCPPCTGTVQSSLSRVKGVKSVTVDWNKKNAKVEFDESVLPAQALAAAIEGTPHMMGGGMRYAGWLALSVPTLTDDASGQKLKDVVGKVEGVKSVAVYPSQHSASVLLSGKGSTSSQQIIDTLAKEGIIATLF